ncbi:MAG TPA: S41 family peptidase [Candidatus Limnocylindria bacterium]|nr:S41 family peptidase [Candidatus Limnocylindria bacterium]
MDNLGSQNIDPVPAPPVHHQDNNSFPKKAAAVLLLIVITFYVGYQSGHKGFVFNPKSFTVVNQNNAPTDVDYNLLWDAINVVNSKYIDKPANAQKVLYGAVSGAVASLGDPYTTFFPPQQLSDFKTSLKGSFGGIGAEVGQKDGNVVVISPIDDTPASRAGLMPNDIIAAVNASSTAGLSVDEVVTEIRGPKGTKVTLTLIRSGKDKPFDVTITRDTIVIKSVKLTYKETVGPDENKMNIAIIKISEFGDDTTSLFTQAVNDVLTHNVDGIIIDLRNNPGGYLQTAVDVASNWVKEGDIVVSEAHSDGRTIKYTGEGNPRLAGIKTEVLINGGSASAAEILSGALYDHGFAKLVGEKSFGKGSVQELVDLPGGSAVKVTIAKWITPNGVNLNHNGLDPDVTAKLTADDVSSGKDPQMDAAMQEVIR